MLDYSIAAHRNNPGYEVRAVVTNSRLKVNDKESQDRLNAMRQKLGQVIPVSLKPKFNLTHKELIISIRAETANRSQNVVNKLTEFIREAKRAVEKENPTD